jgi:hypothetical protein
MGGMQGADGRPAEAGLNGLATASGPPGFSRDPQVAGVAALEFGDDHRSDAEPPGQDLHGWAAERARSVGEFDACLAVQLQGADVEMGEFRD